MNPSREIGRQPSKPSGLGSHDLLITQQSGGWGWGCRSWIPPLTTRAPGSHGVNNTVPSPGLAICFAGAQLQAVQPLAAEQMGYREQAADTQPPLNRQALKNAGAMRGNQTQTGSTPGGAYSLQLGP
eukprot:CAMPEP_0174368390 /NCGR_PEP_ID=MMETSP0811_2-20130205/88899_1 /TAXON_ID=73025 ORGANISM="Eutreptiella gymnastica-like, Strain CCMP1594" /NCGR_SAMPLE_ID=MMETSP0811_2 /ASSEMBLY_ACC=CAM_ASM_000667 /LENGTH=126 /DNA_ID=CAMNT_0015511861 /DNA_START=1147 /DNA_END=1528 /DNA_ORIENTATION=-